jgi:hypothetical protein
MVHRCTNPNDTYWADYGGRGITVCDRWLGSGGFSKFLADVGERPPGLSLDRIDNDGDYEPGNCRWATQGEQHQNTRVFKLTNAKVIEIRDLLDSGRSLSEITAITGIGKQVMTVVRTIEALRSEHA